MNFPEPGIYYSPLNNSDSIIVTNTGVNFNLAPGKFFVYTKARENTNTVLTLPTAGANVNNPFFQPVKAAVAVYPNPGKASNTTVVYDVPKANNIIIDVYNTNGMLMGNLFKGYSAKGRYTKTLGEKFAHLPQGSIHALARTLSLVENEVPGYNEYLQQLPYSSTSVIGITGPPGAGKSTLSSVLAGRADYEVTGGEVSFNGKDLLEMSPEDRAREGVFLAFQYPVEIPGVSTTNFLKTAINEKRKFLGQEPMEATAFLKFMREKMELMEMDKAHLHMTLS